MAWPSSVPRAGSGSAAGHLLAQRVNAWLMHRMAKPVLFVLASAPAGWLVWAAFTDALGANPAEALIRSLGDWTLRFLVLVLLVTPLRTMARLPALARLRRMTGLFVFFYASLHLVAYAWFDMGFDAGAVVLDVVDRPFILVGTVGWLLLLLLAATSFNQAIRTLGTRRWQWLHRSVYGVAALAVLHFFWMRTGKSDFTEVFVYAAIFAVLLGWRLHRRLTR
jgi:sulfoxide reductase heme-binding subunit YedZ